MKLSVLCVALSLCACAVPQVSNELPTYTVGTAFDEQQAGRAMEPGVNSVKGSGFMRQQGGGVVTCAGSAVFLIPATQYATFRMYALYGNFKDGTNVYAGRGFRFQPDPSAYMALMKKTTCDAQGAFMFDRVADGNFYVITTVLWQIGNNRQGGALMQPVTVKDGQLLSVVLSS